MKVLVTGAGGFIGSHLVEALIAQGHEVVALVRYNSKGSIGWLQPTRGLQIIRGDIIDYDCVKTAAAGCDVVYHLAALIGIPYSYVAPKQYVDVNVMGTLNVLRAAPDARIVLTSTSEVYGSNTGGFAPMDEEHKIHPQSPYAASKVASDALGLSFNCSFDQNIGIIRPFNTFGPRQSTRAVIPTIIRQAIEWEEIRLGALSPKRDFMFVSDTVEGFLAMGESRSTGPFNIGTGNSYSIREVVEAVLKIVNKGLPVIEDCDRLRPVGSEVSCLRCDASMAMLYLSWRPSVSLEDGLRKCIKWYSENSMEDVLA